MYIFRQKLLFVLYEGKWLIHSDLLFGVFFKKKFWTETK